MKSGHDDQTGISYLHFSVGRDVGLPAHRVEAVICDLLVLGQRVVSPGHLDGVMAQHGGLNAHGRHHGRGVWYWGVWSMEEFVEVNIGVYGVCSSGRKPACTHTN